MRKIRFLVSAGIGAAAAYLFDPKEGRRRREALMGKVKEASPMASGGSSTASGDSSWEAPTASDAPVTTTGTTSSATSGMPGAGTATSTTGSPAGTATETGSGSSTGRGAVGSIPR